MEPEVRERFEKIEAILRERAEIGRQIDLRMDRAERRMAKHDERMAKHDERFADHDKKLEATRQLVKGGIVYIQKMNATVSALSRTVDKLAKSQQAFVDSLKKGGNGNGRKHPKF